MGRHLLRATLAVLCLRGACGNKVACATLHDNECWPAGAGHELRSFACTSVEDCCAACNSLPGCAAFTFSFLSGGVYSGVCYLKDGLEILPSPGLCTSGGTQLPSGPLPAPPAPGPAPPGAKNVLLILVDDLRPELGLYGSHVPTPNLDAFGASPGTTTFTNAYVQYSFCCPSRNSFMSGRRPTQTKSWQFLDDFRESDVGRDWVTLPQWFKQHGYFAHGLGKLFHPDKPAKFDPPSWSDPDNVADDAGRLPTLPEDEAHWQPELESRQPADLSGAGCLTGALDGSYCELNGTVGTDDGLADNARAALALMANYSQHSGHPFFLGVGFHKPHLPWLVPTRFFEPLGSIDDTALPKHERPPQGMPSIAWNKGLGTHALDSYISDCPKYPLHVFENASFVAFPNQLTKSLRRAYYAAVSYMDHLVGRVLDALDASGAADNTVVAFMGDHGYSLGELNLWCKMTVFEAGTRVPLMIRVPPMTGSTRSRGEGVLKTNALAEAVDLFPTLVEVAGAEPAPEYCDGDSLAPVLSDPGVSVKAAAYSEFVKCYSCCREGSDAEQCLDPQGDPGSWGRCEPKNAADLHEMETCFHVPRSQIDFIGYSVRTQRWRYTEWLHFDGQVLHGNFARQVAHELYDHAGDDGGNHDFDAFENENVVEDPAHADVVREHHELLLKGFPSPAVASPLHMQYV